MAFLGIDNRQDLPKVSYSTALDYFVAVNFVFVLATVIQFAGVHFFTKHGFGEEMPGHYDHDSDYDDEVDQSEYTERVNILKFFREECVIKETALKSSLLRFEQNLKGSVHI